MFSCAMTRSSFEAVGVAALVRAHPKHCAFEISAAGVVFTPQEKKVTAQSWSPHSRVQTGKGRRWDNSLRAVGTAPAQRWGNRELAVEGL